MIVSVCGHKSPTRTQYRWQSRREESEKERERKKYDGHWSECLAIHSFSHFFSSSWCHYSVGGNDDKRILLPRVRCIRYIRFISKEINAPVIVVVLLKCYVISYSSAIRQLISFAHIHPYLDHS